MARHFIRPFRSQIRNGGYSLPPFEMAITQEADSWKSSRNLFHYTNLSSFKAICKSRKLFLGECISANDIEEIVFTIELIHYDLLDRYATHPYKHALIAGLDEFVKSIPDSIFAFSLTESHDLLSQWRGYGRDEGIVIGFTYRLLKDISISNGLLFKKILYYTEDHMDAVRALTDLYVSAVSVLDENEKVIKQRSFFLDFLRVAPFIKNGAFNEEREWRLYTTVLEHDPYGLASGYEYLNGRRYLPVSFMPRLYTENFSLSSIFIGPCVNWKDRWEEIKIVLADEGMTCGEISVSMTPYQPVKR
jgi:hypothetical protein